MITTIVKQLGKNFSSRAGWFPLIIIYYLFYLYFHPRQVTFLGIPIVENEAIWVVLMAFVTSLIGDAIDKGIWDSFKPQYAKDMGTIAKIKLDIKEGSYAVAKALLNEASKYNGTGSQLSNEFTKFSRSFAVFMLFLTIVPTINFREPLLSISWTGVWLPTINFNQPMFSSAWLGGWPPLWPRIITLILFFVFIWLSVKTKGMHITKLYGQMNSLIANDKKGLYAVHDLDGNPSQGAEIRLFFWNSVLVASAMKMTPSKKIEQLEQLNRHVSVYGQLKEGAGILLEQNLSWQEKLLLQRTAKLYTRRLKQLSPFIQFNPQKPGAGHAQKGAAYRELEKAADARAGSIEKGYFAWMERRLLEKVSAVCTRNLQKIGELSEPAE